MKILVCIRQGLDGEINPFDACAYEAALSIKEAEVILISMAPPSAKDFLLRLTRLGAKKAILLTDTLFAGADTLATAYTLSKAAEKLDPDLIFCGRQTLIGDTAQTGPMLSVFAGTALISNVMSVDEVKQGVITCTTRDRGLQSANFPALLTIERINSLRLPSITSKLGEVELWSAADIGADPEKCGLVGSPTRVLRTFQNESGRRKCKFISAKELENAIAVGLEKEMERVKAPAVSPSRLSRVLIVGEAPRPFAETVSDNIMLLPLTDEADLVSKITEANPDAVLWGSDSRSKQLAARTAAILGLGLCADCTALEAENDELIMYRPALSGSVIAKIKSNTRPAMATVRAAKSSADIIMSVGYGAKDSVDKICRFAKKIGAEVCASRRMVDNGYLNYSAQVGLTGKTVAPPVYIAAGVSGAVHHIVGMEQSGTVIAINPDKNAPIFDYADFGIVASIDDVLNEI